MRYRGSVTEEAVEGASGRRSSHPPASTHSGCLHLSLLMLAQGPPGTGKSSFIAAAITGRVPAHARTLACTSTNKAIDSLLSKLEASGMQDMITVGARANMGPTARRYLLSNRLLSDGKLRKMRAALAVLQEELELLAEQVAWKRSHPA